MRAAELFESFANPAGSMSTLGNMVDGPEEMAVERTRILSEGAGKALGRSRVVVFDPRGKDYLLPRGHSQRIPSSKEDGDPPSDALLHERRHET